MMAEQPVIAACHGDRAEQTAQAAQLLAGALGCPLIVVCAYDYEPSVLSSVVTGPPGNAERFAAACEAADALAPEGAETRVVPADGVADALLEEATRTDAAALVLGGDVDGHVAQQVLQHSNRPVLVVGRGADPSALKAIGVAYDGSAGSRLAMSAAQRIAAGPGARVELLGVAPTPSPMLVDPLNIRNRGVEREHEIERVLHTAQLGDDSGIELSSRVMIGDAGHALVETSADLDLLVCGSHSRGTIGRLVLGSVSATLVRNAYCPVLVVPAAARSHPDRPLAV
jgi:nucleotide-binding universal stress UspA family protein